MFIHHNVQMLIPRRRFLRTPVAGLSSSLLWSLAPQSLRGRGATEPERVFERDYWNDWPQYFRARVNEARARRKAELLSLRTASDVRKRAETVRARLWELIGGRMRKTPLNPQTAGVIRRNGYRIEKVIFESQPQVYVTANLYVPAAGRRPFPGIVSPLGHYPEGKAAHDYQHVYQNLARKGFVVLAFDPFSQGERAQYLDPKTGESIYRDPDDGHDEAGMPLVLLGGTFTQYRAWDAIRALDYLVTRPEVDAKRIGCVGHSGGATMTMFLCALEPRIRAAVIVEGHFRNYAGPHYEPPQGYGDAEQNIAGGLPFNIDRGDLVWSFAPKPVLLCYTPRDGIGWTTPAYLDDVQEIFEEARSAYRILGAEERIRLFASFLPHSFDFFNRRETYGWFNRWLGDESSGTEEKPFDASPPGALNCTSTGQVLTSLGGRSVLELTAERARALVAPSPFLEAGAQALQAQQRVRSSLEKLLGLPPTRAPLRARTRSKGNQDNLSIEEIEFHSEEEVRVPGWFLKPVRASERVPAILCLQERGKDQVAADETNELRALVRKGFALFVADLRGSGDTAPCFPVAAPRNFPSGDWMIRNYSYAGLAIGKPVLGQRVWDFLRCLDYLAARPDVDASRIYVAGARGGSVVALLGTALDRRPRSLFCEGLLADFRSVAEEGKYTWGLAWFVSGFLREMDLPDAIAAIAPRPVWTFNAVGPQDEVLSESALRTRLRPAFASYSALNVPGRLRTLVERAQEKPRLLMSWLETT
ncbi:MAG: alpha/beta hydrolase family protein [Terriglobia bacterium]